MVKKKKIKGQFQEFRNHDKSAYTTIKTSLKSVLHNRDLVQPAVNHLVFEINDLIIHTYQFIRLYILNAYNHNQSLPIINETFILYCIKTLGVRDNRGKKCKDAELFETLNIFYQTEYQPLLNHTKINLKNTTFYVALFSHASAYIFIQ